jgi:hypothetical protein
MASAGHEPLGGLEANKRLFRAYATLALVSLNESDADELLLGLTRAIEYLLSWIRPLSECDDRRSIPRLMSLAREAFFVVTASAVAALERIDPSVGKEAAEYESRPPEQRR